MYNTGLGFFFQNAERVHFAAAAAVDIFLTNSRRPRNTSVVNPRPGKIAEIARGVHQHPASLAVAPDVGGNPRMTNRDSVIVHGQWDAGSLALSNHRRLQICVGVSAVVSRARF